MLQGLEGSTYMASGATGLWRAHSLCLEGSSYSILGFWKDGTSNFVVLEDPRDSKVRVLGGFWLYSFKGYTV